MEKIRFISWINNITEQLTRLLPDWLTGKSDILIQRYYIKYGDRDSSHLIKKNKIRTASAYLFITTIFCISAVVALAEEICERKEISSISRPQYGQEAVSVPLEVRMNYEDIELTKVLNLKVQHKELSDIEKQNLLHNYLNRLEKVILNGNKDLNHINKQLFLPSHDNKTGITVNWTSSVPDIINEKGEIDLIKAQNRQCVELTAELTLDRAVTRGKFQLCIDKKADTEEYERGLIDRLERKLEVLSGTNYSKNLILPRELDDGISIRWYYGKEHDFFLIVILYLSAMLLVYCKRFYQINKEIKQMEQSVLRDLPGFINKLVLLLNAGLVVSTAISKIVDDYETYNKERKTRKYLYEELLEIQKRVGKSKVSLIKELKQLSQRCGVREMVRLAAVISDNWSKGSALAEKLEAEAEMMWLVRKTRAEEHGKIAETKLTLPLMILLLVLIMVVITPAIMEM